MNHNNKTIYKYEVYQVSQKMSVYSLHAELPSCTWTFFGHPVYVEKENSLKRFSLAN